MRRTAAFIAAMAISAAVMAQATRPAWETMRPKEVLGALSRALDGGDRQTIETVMLARSPAEQQLLAATIRFAEAMAGLQRAAVEQYGTAAWRSLGGEPAERWRREQDRLDRALEVVERDEAVVQFAEPDVTVVRLVRVDGRWRVPMAEHAQLRDRADIAAQAADLGRMAQVVDEVTVEVAAGREGSPEEMLLEVRKRLTQTLSPTTSPSTVPATGPATTPAATRPAP